jgi:hypothetical protein
MKALGQLRGQWLVIVLILLFTMSAVGQDADKKIPPVALSEQNATQALQKAPRQQNLWVVSGSGSRPRV